MMGIISDKYSAMIPTIKTMLTMIMIKNVPKNNMNNNKMCIILKKVRCVQYYSLHIPQYIESYD